MTIETTGDRVYRLRKQRGYSTYRLAEIVGCRHTTIDHIEKSVYSKSKYLPAIACALGTTTEYLLEGDQVKVREEPGSYRARLIEWMETGQLSPVEIQALSAAAETMIAARC